MVELHSVPTINKPSPLLLPLLVILVVLIVGIFLSNYFNVSLPYMSCGGSATKQLNNTCIVGFECVYSEPIYFGAGGKCLPILPTSAPTATPSTPLENDSVGVMCTMDAKICPDGSAVGRSGPNCEFAPCPGEAN